MEQTQKPTSSLVLPIVGKLINTLKPEYKVVTFDYTDPLKVMKRSIQVCLIKHLFFPTILELYRFISRKDMIE